MEHISTIIEHLIAYGVEFGKKIIVATIIYFVGRYAVSLLNRFVGKIMERQRFEPEVKTFLASAVSISLNVLLFIAIIGALGIETTSFAALLASAGVAVGMALSGQMQNLAGGVIILLNKPYKIGDYITTNGMSGTVTAIQIFSTKLLTIDNVAITVPNGIISSAVLTNYSEMDRRRIDMVIGVEYGTQFEKVKQTLHDIFHAEQRILQDPQPFVALSELADSSVNIIIRVWTTRDDYWAVYFGLKETIYKTFNEQGISFPFPQVTVHQAKEQS